MSDGTLESNVRYRLAYGIARRVLDANTTTSMAHGERTVKVPSGFVEAVAREAGCDPGDEDVLDAIDDAMAGKRPRW